MSPETVLRLLEHSIEIRILLIHSVDNDNFRNAIIGGGLPHAVCPDAQSLDGVNHHQSKIPNPQSAQSFANEIEVTRRINDVEFLALPIQVQKRGGNRYLPLLFTDVIIGDGRAVGDAAHPPDDTAAGQHGLAQHGFTRGGMADDGEVTDIRW